MGKEEQKMEEKKKTEEKPEEKKPENEDKEKEKKKEPQEIVLKIFMHCEGCAKKIHKCFKGFEGVEDVTTDCKTSKVVVKGDKAVRTSYQLWLSKDHRFRAVRTSYHILQKNKISDIKSRQHHLFYRIFPGAKKVHMSSPPK